MPEEAMQQESAETQTEAPAEESVSTAESAEAAQATAAEATPEATEAGTSIPAWVTSQMPKDLREDESLHQFEKPADLARAYLDASQKLTQGITPPGEDATEDEWRAYRQAVGVPDAPDGYEFETGDIEVDDDLVGWFREAAHEAGLSANQAQRLLEKWNESSTPEVQAERLAEQRQQVESDLRKEWGRQFDGNMRLAYKAMEAFAGEDFREYLDTTGMGNDPRMIKAFTQIGQKMADDSFVSGEKADREETEEDVLRRRYPKMYADWEAAGR